MYHFAGWTKLGIKGALVHGTLSQFTQRRSVLHFSIALPLFDRGELFLVFNDAHQPLRFVGIRLCAGPASHPGGPISEISCFLCVQFAIRNLSDAGAALDVPTSFGIPHEFQLVMEIDRAVRQCRGIWRREKRIGVVLLLKAVELS